MRKLINATLSFLIITFSVSFPIIITVVFYLFGNDAPEYKVNIFDNVFTGYYGLFILYVIVSFIVMGIMVQVVFIALMIVPMYQKVSKFIKKDSYV